MKYVSSVTGGAGFLGSHMVDLLLKKKHKVIVVDDLSTGIRKNISHNINNKNFFFIKKNLQNFNISDLKTKKLDYIFHFAGRAAIVPSIVNPSLYFNTNVFGLALLTKELIPVMKKQSQGTIINIGSSASIRGFKNGSVYAASKFAVRALSQCWQAELRPHNIRVCQVNPSEVTTAFAQKDRKERADLDHKLSPKEIAHTIISIIEMRNKGFVPEVNIWATNPF